METKERKRKDQGRNMRIWMKKKKDNNGRKEERIEEERNVQERNDMGSGIIKEKVIRKLKKIKGMARNEIRERIQNSKKGKEIGRKEGYQRKKRKRTMESGEIKG